MIKNSLHNDLHPLFFNDRLVKSKTFISNDQAVIQKRDSFFH